MENNERMMELLERMEKANRKQVAYARMQFLFSAIAAICCAVLLFSGMKILPQLQEAAVQAEGGQKLTIGLERNDGLVSVFTLANISTIEFG